MSAQQLLEPEDALQDLSIQMQMFAHAPTRQAWDIVQELYNRAEVQLHPDFARVHEKIKMFFAVVLSRQPEWAATDEHKQLLSPVTKTKAPALSQQSICVMASSSVVNA